MLFYNKEGKAISIEKLIYDDLKQLLDNDIEEGWKVEYKSRFNDDVKKKIPQVVTSFANSDGGWLFIGINDDKTISDIEKPKGEIFLTIAQIVERISPLPRFEAVFLENPNRLNYGVIIVQVQEGLNPPYLSNGTIYVRSGSSKIPVLPERSTVDYLFKKRDAVTALTIKSIVDNRLNNFAITQQSETIENIKKQYADIFEALKIEIDELEKLPLSKIIAEETAKKEELKKEQEIINNNFGSSFMETMKNLTMMTSAIPSLYSGVQKDPFDYFKEEFEEIKIYINIIKKDINLSVLFDLGDLKITLNGILQNEINYMGDDRAKQKCKKLLSLQLKLRDYFATIDLINSIKEKYFLRLVLSNEGNRHDEDIIVKLFLPHGSYFSHTNIRFNTSCIESNEKIIDIFSPLETVEIDSYNDYPIEEHLIPPTKISGSIGFSSYVDYEDSEYLVEKQINKLDSLICYELYCFDENTEVLKVRFSKLLANSNMFFPAPIMIDAQIDKIHYEINSKYNGMIIKGELIIKSR